MYFVAALLLIGMILKPMPKFVSCYQYFGDQVKHSMSPKSLGQYGYKVGMSNPNATVTDPFLASHHIIYL